MTEAILELIVWTNMFIKRKYISSDEYNMFSLKWTKLVVTVLTECHENIIHGYTLWLTSGQMSFVMKHFLNETWIHFIQWHQRFISNDIIRDSECSWSRENLLLNDHIIGQKIKYSMYISPAYNTHHIHHVLCLAPLRRADASGWDIMYKIDNSLWKCSS